LLQKNACNDSSQQLKNLQTSIDRHSKILERIITEKLRKEANEKSIDNIESRDLNENFRKILAHSPANIRISEGVEVEKTVTIGYNSRIAPNCKISGKTNISPNTRIDIGVSAHDAELSGHIPAYSKWTTEGFSGFTQRPQKARQDTPFLGQEALNALISNEDFSTVLDVGSGQGLHADAFTDAGKITTRVDFASSYYFEKNPKQNVIKGNYLEIDLKNKFDCVWASHVLEHQPNQNLFLKKIVSDTKEGGIICITVPPLKHEIVGGHLSLWNAGLLIYNLIFAGTSCKSCRIKSYGYNISIIVKKQKIKLPELTYDYGDIKRLKQHFPDSFDEPFFGNIQSYNWYK
jgi:SAM-dependent methyltransferase